MRTLVAICAIIAGISVRGEIRFNPLNVRSTEIVTGVTHPEFRTATNQLWEAVGGKASTNDFRDATNDLWTAVESKLSTNEQNICVGKNASIGINSGVVAVGATSKITANGGTSIGMLSEAGLYSSALGYRARAAGNYSIAIGDGSAANDESSVVIGRENSSKGAHTVVLGDSQTDTNKFYIGSLSLAFILSGYASLNSVSGSIVVKKKIVNSSNQVTGEETKTYTPATTGNLTTHEIGAHSSVTGGVMNGIYPLFTHINPSLSIGLSKFHGMQTYDPLEATTTQPVMFSFGGSVHTKAENAVTMGWGVNNTNNYSFCWSGDADRYYSPTKSANSSYGTKFNGGFHINPKVRSGMTTPLENFWIGESNLKTWILSVAPSSASDITCTYIGSQTDVQSALNKAIQGHVSSSSEKQCDSLLYGRTFDWRVNENYDVGFNYILVDDIFFKNLFDDDENPASITNLLTKIRKDISDVPSTSTNTAHSVVSNYLYYASRNTSLSNNAELRLYSGEWVNAEYDGEGTADVILDLSGISSDKVTDTLMILNCAATGTLKVATSSGDCRVVHKKDANPLELKEGLNLLTFSRYRLSNGTNDVLVTNNELE